MWIDLRRFDAEHWVQQPIIGVRPGVAHLFTHLFTHHPQLPGRGPEIPQIGHPKLDLGPGRLDRPGMETTVGSKRKSEGCNMASIRPNVYQASPRGL